MNKENDFAAHLKQISPKEWSRLFAFIPKIRQSKKFGKVIVGKTTKEGYMQMPYYSLSNVVMSFRDTFYELEWLPGNDWSNWEEGRRILQNSETVDFSALDNVTLCKLVEAILRMDHFNDGTLLSFFNNGTILKILEVMKSNVLKEKNAN